MQEEKGRSEGKNEIIGKGKKGGGIGKEERKGEDEEEEEDGGGLEGGETVNRGVAFEERVGIGGNDELMDEGDEKANGKEIEREVTEAVVLSIGGGRRERVEGFGGVGMRRFEIAASGGDEVVEAK